MLISNYLFHPSYPKTNERVGYDFTRFADVRGIVFYTDETMTTKRWNPIESTLLSLSTSTASSKRMSRAFLLRLTADKKMHLSSLSEAFRCTRQVEVKNCISTIQPCCLHFIDTSIKGSIDRKRGEERIWIRKRRREHYIIRFIIYSVLKSFRHEKKMVIVTFGSHWPSSQRYFLVKFIKSLY